MNEHQNSLETLASFVQTHSFENGERGLQAEILISDNIAADLSALNDSPAVEVIRITGVGRPEQAIGSKRQVIIEPTRVPACYWAYDLNDLIKGARYEHPNQFYLADHEFLFDGNEAENIPRHIQAYFSVIQLQKLFLDNEIADHIVPTPSPKTLVFLGNGSKLELPLSYTAEVLANSADDICKNVEMLTSFFNDAKHKSEKKHLFKALLLEILKGHNRELRFSALLKNLSAISKRLHDNYELFVSEFSFEDEREKLKNQKLDYMLKLNESFGSIQNKLLAVPISLILVGGQMKAPTEKLPEVLIPNLVILLGAWVFAFFMCLLISNQKHSLEAIHKDYSRRKDRLELELPNLFKELADLYTNLDLRYRKLKSSLSTLLGLVLSAAIISLIIFIYQTPTQPITELFNLTWLSTETSSIELPPVPEG
jgi:hypothetical protein